MIRCPICGAKVFFRFENIPDLTAGSPGNKLLIQQDNTTGLNPIVYEGNSEDEQTPPITNVQAMTPENEAPAETEGVENPEPEVHENRNQQQQRQQQVEANRAAARGTQNQNPMLDLTV